MLISVGTKPSWNHSLLFRYGKPNTFRTLSNSQYTSGAWSAATEHPAGKTLHEDGCLDWALNSSLRISPLDRQAADHPAPRTGTGSQHGAFKRCFLKMVSRNRPKPKAGFGPDLVFWSDWGWSWTREVTWWYWETEGKLQQGELKALLTHSSCVILID